MYPAHASGWLELGPASGAAGCPLRLPCKVAMHLRCPLWIAHRLHPPPRHHRRLSCPARFLSLPRCAALRPVLPQLWDLPGNLTASRAMSFLCCSCKDCCPHPCRLHPCVCPWTCLRHTRQPTLPPLHLRTLHRRRTTCRRPPIGSDLWRKCSEESVAADLTFACVSHLSELGNKCLSNSPCHAATSSANASQPHRSPWRRTIPSHER